MEGKTHLKLRAFLEQCVRTKVMYFFSDRGNILLAQLARGTDGRIHTDTNTDSYNVFWIRIRI